jgi:hypothetical protein
MVTIAAVATCVLLGCLAFFQLSLVLGAPLGRFAWGGQHRVLPLSLRVGSVVSIAIYACVALVVLARADLVDVGVSPRVIEVACWVLTGYFFLGIGLNLASRSKPERFVMTPLCVLLCVLTGVVALG